MLKSKLLFSGGIQESFSKIWQVKEISWTNNGKIKYGYLHWSTEKNEKVSLDDDKILEIRRQGSGTPIPVTELDEGTSFKGDENDLILTALYNGYFSCRLDLSNFPFDVQECSIKMNFPREVRKYISIKPMSLKYSGKYHSKL